MRDPIWKVWESNGGKDESEGVGLTVVIESPYSCNHSQSGLFGADPGRVAGNSEGANGESCAEVCRRDRGVSGGVSTPNTDWRESGP